MATHVFFVFFLSLIIHASFSLTIPLDVKTMKLLDRVRESELTERSPAVFDPHLRYSEGAELVQILPLVDGVPSLDAGEGKHNRKVRAIFLTPVKCAGDMFEYARRCWTKEEYDRVKEDNEDK